MAGSKSVFKRNPGGGYGSGGNAGTGKILGFIVVGVMVLSLLVGFLANSDEAPSLPEETRPTQFQERPTLPQMPEEKTTKEPETEKKDAGNITMMLYFDGADLEELYSNGTDAIKEILVSGVDTNKHNILIYTCGSNLWHGYNIPSDKDCIYQVKNNRIELLQEYPAKKVGESDTLGAFMKYCVDNFPAAQYGLLLQDHGGGPIHGVCSDFRNGHDTLSLQELQKAFSYAGFSASEKLEFVLFDACLMASVEVADAMSKYVNYMVASENVSYVYGSDYSFMRSLNNAADGEAVCKAYVDSFYNASMELGKRILQSGQRVYDITYSCLDLSRMPSVTRAINSYFSKLGSSTSQGAVYVRRAAENARGVTEFSDSYGSSVDAVYDLVDFRDMLNAIGAGSASKEYSSLLSELDKLVIYNKSSISRMSGVTIYAPKHINGQTYIYSQLGFASEYAKYVETCYNDSQSYSSFHTWGSLDSFEEKSSSSSATSAFTVNLTKAQQDTFASAEYFILSNDADGKYAFGKDEYVLVSGGNDVSVDSKGVLTANFDSRTAVVSTSSGNVPVTATLYRNKTADGDIIYNMYGNLTENEPTANSSSIQVETISGSSSDRTKFTLSGSGNNLEITSAMKISSPDGVVASCDLLDLAEFDGIELTNYVKKASYNAEGQLQPVSEWDDQLSAVTSSFALNDIDFVLEEKDSSEELYAVLIVTDIYGNRHMTDIQKLK